MARYRSRMAMMPINRIKHVVDSSATLTAASVLPIRIVLAKDAPVLANVTEVVTGSKVYGFYLRVEVGVKDIAAGVISNCYLMVSKNPGGNLTMPAPNSVGSNDNKKYIIHQEMVMLNNVSGGNPRTIFNGVIKIPKGYSRFGPNDTLDVSILAPAVNTVVCLQAHYKEFR